ncbi:exocyst complex component 1-like [Protopterus annectens]|uniref:exocyst complex component 1-like n=1 Tax=Protopterus annectens TaxID=7888 RepID=UPI001CFB5B34|nr:exocyst complex component 1-like [Protopterus annectens]
MSSLLKEDLEKKLFKLEGHKLYEFIEIEYSGKERHYLCVSVPKNREVQISVVKHYRISLDDKYEKLKTWLLKDLEMIDGKEADADNSYFDMQFDKICTFEAYSCASKYSFTRCLINLNKTYYKKEIKIVNFDDTYIDDGMLESNKGDCMVLLRVCFYAFNLVCLSLCPVP